MWLADLDGQRKISRRRRRRRRRRTLQRREVLTVALVIGQEGLVVGAPIAGWTLASPAMTAARTKLPQNMIKAVMYVCV